MPTPSRIPVEHLEACLRERFGVSPTGSQLLDVGDATSRIYHVHEPTGDLFVKVRTGPANEPGLRVPRFLADHGIDVAIAPLPTLEGRLSAELDGAHLVAYPYVDGASGGDTGMTTDHWKTLGVALRRIHDLAPSEALAATMRTEDFTPVDLPRVFAIESEVSGHAPDPIVRELAELWREHSGDVERITRRFAELAVLASSRSGERAICHADIHPWNVLLRHDGGIAVVDWDDTKLAPRERDLMMMGIFASNDPAARGAFEDGYGPFDADPLLIAYYQHERAVQDLAANGDELLFEGSTDEARQQGLGRMRATFGPGSEVAIAIASDDAIASG